MLIFLSLVGLSKLKSFNFLFLSKDRVSRLSSSDLSDTKTDRAIAFVRKLCTREKRYLNRYQSVESRPGSTGYFDNFMTNLLISA